jgi:effector-binding domain-containing protein
MTSAAEQQPTVVDVTERPTAVVRGVVPMSELREFFDRAFGVLGPQVAGEEGLVAGPPFSRYAGPPGDTAELEVGFPLTRPVQPSGDVAAGSLPGGRVVRLVHHGDYEQLGSSWGRLVAWADEQGLRRAPALWEVYLTEPTPDGDPDAMRTELNWLLLED